MIHAFDKQINIDVARLPRWLRPVMLLLTLAGEPPFTVGIAAAILGYGFALGKPHFETAGEVAIITILISSLLKLALRRTRPRNEYSKHMFIKTFSFPSGHAAGSLVSYGLIALVISLKWPELLVVAWCTAIVLVLLVSLSRVYLGAHYASDIVGGWIIGAIGLVVIAHGLL